MTRQPILHLVEDAEEKLERTLKKFDPLLPPDRQHIADAGLAFQDRLLALGVEVDEMERRRFKVLSNTYGSRNGIRWDIELTFRTHELESADTKAAQSVGIDPKTLRDSYLASFPEKITILDICWAAKQRYREWTRWLGGSLKSGSKPDKAFRAVLSSGKRPEQYRSDPRPKGWH